MKFFITCFLIDRHNGDISFGSDYHVVKTEAEAIGLTYAYLLKNFPTPMGATTYNYHVRAKECTPETIKLIKENL